MSTAGREIWLLGGYGDVGAKTAAHLLALTDTTVTLAGRDRRMAERTARSLGPRARGELLDVTDAVALEHLRDASAVISFTEAVPPRLASALVERGIDYIDTSADPEYWRSLDGEMQGIPEALGTAVLGAGLVPGLSGVLAGEIVQQAPTTRQIDIVLEMGLGRRHGRAGTRWTLANLAGSYPVKRDGEWGRAVPGEVRRSVQFSDGTEPVDAIGFGFTDQIAIAVDLGLDTVRSFLALDPRFATRLLKASAGRSVGRVIANHADLVARAAMALPPLGGSGTRLSVEGFDRSGRRTERIQLVSQADQAELTAIMVAATAAAVLKIDGRGPTGLPDLLSTADVQRLITDRTVDAKWSD